MQRSGLVMDHPAVHWNRVSQRLVGNSNLFEGVNPARRNCQVDRATTDDVSFARISAPFIKIDFVSAPSKIRRKQAPSQSAADQNKSCHSPRIYQSGNQESRKDCETDTCFLPALIHFLECVAQVIKDIAWQQRLLTLSAVENCDLCCASA